MNLDQQYYIKDIPKGQNNNEFDSLDEERNKNEHDPKTPNNHAEQKKKKKKKERME